jgi:anti-sigma regulatory factor (Ser/Thr protein kinase)
MIEALVLVSCTIIEIIVIIWGLGQLNKTIYDASDELEEKLDGKLASIIQQMGFNGEPINPIQAAIGELLKNAANKNNSSGIIDLRDENGQFKKND